MKGVVSLLDLLNILYEMIQGDSDNNKLQLKLIKTINKTLEMSIEVEDNAFGEEVSEEWLCLLVFYSQYSLHA